MDVQKQKRATAKGGITRIYNIVDRHRVASTKLSSEEATVRLESLERFFQAFITAQNAIDSQNAVDNPETIGVSDQEAALVETEERYYTTTATLRAWEKGGQPERPSELGEVDDRSTPQSESAAAELSTAINALAQHQSNLSKLILKLGETRTSSPLQAPLPGQEVKLPDVKIPTFSGQYEDWTTFADLYRSMVHNNERLSKVRKLQYLKGSLVGNAASILKNVAVTDANYDDAWDRLVTRFEKRNCIVDAHIRNLLEQPTMTKASIPELTKLYNCTTESVDALKALDVPVNHWDAILNYVVISKLDSESKQLWAQSLVTTEPATYAKLMEFMDQRLYNLV